MVSEKCDFQTDRAGEPELTVTLRGEIAQRIHDAAERDEETIYEWLIGVAEYYLSGA